MYIWDVLPWYMLLNDDIVLFEKSGAGINFKLGDSKPSRNRVSHEIFLVK